jgi:hypothetical protein
MLPPELGAALKKYGKWSKIPKPERQKLLGKVAGSTAAITTNAAKQASRAFADDTTSKKSAQTPSAAPSATPRAPANLPAGVDSKGWVVSRRFVPNGYNPKNLSVEKSLPFVIAEAKKLVPDAVLFRIDADGVYPDGHADITLAGGSLDFRFISPKRAKRDPNLPLGAKQEFKCMFRIMLDDDGVWSAPLDGSECKEPLLGPPKCTTTQVWKKAIAQGAPTNAIGELGYRGWNGVPKWYFNIDGTKISEVFADDCK